MMETAYAHGINFFDNAEAYGGGGVSERLMGDAIQLGLERGTWERDDLVISTKIFFGGRGRKDTVNSKGLSRKHLFEGLKNSLARMRLDYVDLVFCHRPDPKTPIIETVKGMNHLINQGTDSLRSPLPAKLLTATGCCCCCCDAKISSPE